ncbi:hypothetical protein PRZ48_000933 [Zasmidium cellare]|uniref:Uncharacterized protein n=1 Tax=Zasmidium cellare TaxID=395010 RepID=A0ABR0F162_ZASCE|nr:hypothetical protein PRZ48_000933 [Zasmidium cellare]
MDPSKAEIQAKGHGVYMIQEVIELLEAAGHVCCVTDVKALRYYGAACVSNDWKICVPDSGYLAAMQLIDSEPHKYERVDAPMPQLNSLIHTYSRYRCTQEDRKTLGFYIMPSSEDFLEDLDDNAIERSANNIPYPKLIVFAQNLVSTQKWDRLTELVDGMDLSLEWGQQHLRLGTLSEREVEYARVKMEKYAKSLVRLGRSEPGSISGLRNSGIDKGQKWAQIVSQKQHRAAKHYNAANWETIYRRKGSSDPRLKQDRPV